MVIKLYNITCLQFNCIYYYLSPIVFTIISPQLYLLLSLPNCIYYYLSPIKPGIMNFWTSNQWNNTPLDPLVCHNLGKSSCCKSYVGQAVFVGRLQLNLLTVHSCLWLIKGFSNHSKIGNRSLLNLGKKAFGHQNWEELILDRLFK